MEIVFIIIAIVVAIAAAYGCYHLGRRSVKPPPTLNVVELSDVLNTNVRRTPRQVLQDGVMQLKNEIAASGAVTQEKLDDGNIRVSIKVVV